MQSTQSLFALNGKCAIITGAARGIGRAIALRLAEAGASVVLCDLARAEVEDLARHIEAGGGGALACAADVAKLDDITYVVAAALDRFGGVDVLVNNAAMRGWSTWDTLSEAEWDRFMAVNLKAVFFFSQAAARRMVEQGRGGAIINIASTAAAHPVRWKVDYNAAKAGVAMMTRSLALELGPHMIRVNAIGPGGVDTAGGPGSIQSSFSPEELRKMGEDWRRRMALPVGQLDPEEIANTALYLASDAARMVTGQIVYVDGGYLVG